MTRDVFASADEVKRLREINRELYEALEIVRYNTPVDVLDYFTDGIGSPRLRDVISAAQAKARGEKS